MQNAPIFSSNYREVGYNNFSDRLGGGYTIIIEPMELLKLIKAIHAEYGKIVKVKYTKEDL